MTTKLNLASVLALQAAAQETRKAVDPATHGQTPTVAVLLDVFEDLLADLVDFHLEATMPAKKKRPKK